jgi:hypothetical protein
MSEPGLSGIGQHGERQQGRRRQEIGVWQNTGRKTPTFRQHGAAHEAVTPRAAARANIETF